MMDRDPPDSKPSPSHLKKNFHAHEKSKRGNTFKKVHSTNKKPGYVRSSPSSTSLFRRTTNQRTNMFITREFARKALYAPKTSFPVPSTVTGIAALWAPSAVQFRLAQAAAAASAAPVISPAAEAATFTLGSGDVCQSPRVKLAEHVAGSGHVQSSLRVDVSVDAEDAASPLTESAPPAPSASPSMTASGDCESSLDDDDSVDAADGARPLTEAAVPASTATTSAFAPTSTSTSTCASSTPPVVTCVASSSSTFLPQVRVSDVVQPTFHDAAAATTAAAMTAATTAASCSSSPEKSGEAYQPPRVELAAREYAKHVSGVLIRCSSVLAYVREQVTFEACERASCAYEYESVAAAEAQAGGRAVTESSLKEHVGVLLSVVDGLIDELQVAVRRSNHHEQRAISFEAAFVNEASECERLVHALETRDRVIESLRMEMRSNEEAKQAEEAEAAVREDEGLAERLGNHGGEMYSDSTSTLSLVVSSTTSGSTESSDRKLDWSSSSTEASVGSSLPAVYHDEYEKTQSPAEELDENPRDDTESMLFSVFELREHVAVETRKNVPQSFKLRALSKKVLRSLRRMWKTDPDAFMLLLDPVSIESCLAWCGMSVVNTPSSGNCQFESAIEAALGVSLVQLHALAHEKNSDPAIVLRYRWAVDAVGLLKRAISACGLKEKYTDEALPYVVSETGRVGVVDESTPEGFAAAADVNRAQMNDYWRSLATSSSEVKTRVGVTEWGNFMSLAQACKVLARPIHVVKLADATKKNDDVPVIDLNDANDASDANKAKFDDDANDANKVKVGADLSEKATFSFQRFVPCDPSGPASMFQRCDDIYLETFGAWTQVLLNDVEAADADPCLMPLVLVLRGNHYRATIVDGKALARADELLNEISVHFCGPVEREIPDEEPVTTQASVPMPSTCSLASAPAESHSMTQEPSEPSRPAVSASASMSACSSSSSSSSPNSSPIPNSSLTAPPCASLPPNTKGFSAVLKLEPEASLPPRAPRAPRAPTPTRVRFALDEAGSSRADEPAKDETMASTRGGCLGSTKIKVTASASSGATHTASKSSAAIKGVQHKQGASSPATTKSSKTPEAVVAARGSGSGSTTARKATAATGASVGSKDSKDAKDAKNSKDSKDAKDAKDATDAQDEKDSSGVKKKKEKKAVKKPHWR